MFGDRCLRFNLDINQDIVDEPLSADRPIAPLLVLCYDTKCDRGQLTDKKLNLSSQKAILSTASGWAWSIVKKNQIKFEAF